MKTKLTPKQRDDLRWGAVPYPVIFYGRHVSRCEGLCNDGLMVRMLGHSRRSGVVYKTTDLGRAALESETK